MLARCKSSRDWPAVNRPMKSARATIFRPSHTTALAEALTAIYRLFADDACALQILAGLAGGQSADEIRSSNNLSPVAYDSARRSFDRDLSPVRRRCLRVANPRGIGRRSIGR